MPSKPTPRLTLVSKSPQRADLLRRAGYAFDIVSPAYHEPEHCPPSLTPARFAQALAYYKAASVADRLADRLLLGADTLVVADGQLFGKPADRDDARRMLRILTRTPQQVITGVALLAPERNWRVIADEVTHVCMRPIDDEELERYLDSGGWRDKAGAYGIQAGADAFVERIDGSFSNVIGLPMELLARLIEQFQHGS